MTAFEKLTTTQKVRAALHRDVRAICSETCHFLGLEVTKPAMEIISELVYKKFAVYGTDLEAFAKHAKRSTINSEDVKLLARRNSSLVAHLNTIVPQTTQPPKRRKTAGKPQETPAKTKENVTKTKDDSTKTEEHQIKLPEDKVAGKKDEEVIEEFPEPMLVDSTIDLTFD